VKKIFISATLLFIVLGLCTASKASTLVKVGIYQNPPLVFYDDPSRPQGIYIDVLEHIAKQEGWQLQYIPCRWNECLEMLEQGKIDVQTAIAFSEERLKRFDFTKETLIVNWGIVYAGIHKSIQSLLDLEEKKIAVIEDDIYYQRFSEIAKKFGINVQYLFLKNYDSIMQALKNGRADAGIVSRFFGEMNERRYRLKKTPIIFSPVELTFAICRHSRLKPILMEKIDSYIKRLKEQRDSPYYKSIERHMGRKPVTRVPAWIKGFFIAVSVLIVLFFIMNLWLRAQVKKKTDEIKQRMAELEESRNYIKAIYDATPDMIFIHSADGRIIDINENATRTFGYSLEEFQGLPPQQIMGEGYTQEMALEKLKLALKGHTQEFEWMARNREGKEFPVEVRLRRIEFTDKHGSTVPSVLAIVRDLTEKKEAEKRLQEEQTRLIALLEAIPDLIFIISSDCRFVDYKDSFQYPLYAPPETFLGKKVHEVLPQDVAEKAEKYIRLAIETGRLQSFDYSLPIDNKQRHYEARINRLSDTEVVVIIHDVTEKKEAEALQRQYQEELERLVSERTADLKKRIEEVERLNLGMLNLLEDLKAAYRKAEQLSQRLQESNQELEAFAYSVSHDLRAPLRAMQGFSEALLQDYADRLDETGKDYAMRILKASQRMDNLIQDLLAYSRLTRQDIRRKPISLEGVINEALRVLEDDIKERDAIIKIEKSLPQVLANHSVLYQVILNLISNAIKFVKKGSKPVVRIWAEETGGKVRLNIQDNGIGIPAEHQERIFRIFERLHGIERYPGTGIGLAIVKKGVEQMGGSVGVDSEPDKGSRFWIELDKT